MTLRDQYGEVDVGIGDQFDIRGATFRVICPEDIHQSDSPVWVRLLSGFVEIDGQRIEAPPEAKPIDRVFLFTAELVAGSVREHRLMTFDIAPVQPPARIEKKSPRAPTSKKPAEKYEPNQSTLF